MAWICFVLGCKSAPITLAVTQLESTLASTSEPSPPPPTASTGAPGGQRVDSGANPIPTRFIGAGCVAAQDGSTWCPATPTDYTHFRRLPALEPLTAVLLDPTGLGFQLGKSGQVYVYGKSVSDTDPKRSLDYTKPQPFAKLEHVTTLATGAEYLALDASGALWTWSVTEHLNEDLLVVGAEIALPKVVRRGVKTIWAHSGLCLIADGAVLCNNDGDLIRGHWSTPIEIASWTPEVAFVSHSNTCFYQGNNGLHCYAGWTPPGTGRIELAGHYRLDVRPSKIGFEHILDTDGRLFSLANPSLFTNAPRELEAPKLQHLSHLGRVTDFNRCLCVISDGGQLGCRVDGRFKTEPMVPVLFDQDVAKKKDAE